MSTDGNRPPSLPRPMMPGASIDWTQGSIPLNLFKLSWPLMVSNLLNMLGPFIDVIWVGKLGQAAVAGVGVAGIAVQLLMSAMMGLVTGMRAMVARFTGAGEPQVANRVAAQSMTVSIAFSLVMAVAGTLLAEPILVLLGLEPEVVKEGALYLRIIFATCIVMNVRFMMEGSMQAAGDTLRPMLITVSFRILHIAICPFLVLGLGGFPKLGVVGAGLTNFIAQTIGMVITAWVIFTGRSRLRLNRSDFHIDMPLIRRIIRIGIPASVMGVQMALGSLVFIRLLSPFGTTAVAAHTIWQRVDMILMMPVMGLAMGAGVMAGQNLGARQPERAVKSAWIALIVAEAFMLIWVVGLALGAEGVVRLFNSEPVLVAMGARFLRIAAVGYIFFAFPIVLQSCISGAGDTTPPMLLSILGTWGIQLPLAYFLPMWTDWGVYAIRWAMVITVVIGSTTFTAYFLTGRWKSKRV